MISPRDLTGQYAMVVWAMWRLGMLTAEGYTHLWRSMALECRAALVWLHQNDVQVLVHDGDGGTGGSQ